jgi:hypothetical protein
MMVCNDGGDVRLPTELEWMRELIDHCRGIQEENGIYHPYIYVTVRHGEVTSVTDDKWHVDGFSMLAAHHPEQDYIVTSSPGMEVLINGIDIPNDFDPLKHNLHQYIQEHCDGLFYNKLPPNKIFVIDPYIIHRRPKCSGKRSFVRVSFVPIEIRDDTCCQNPLLPSGPYNREDIRKTLVRYVKE